VDSFSVHKFRSGT